MLPAMWARPACMNMLVKTVSTPKSGSAKSRAGRYVKSALTPPVRSRKKTTTLAAMSA